MGYHYCYLGETVTGLPCTFIILPSSRVCYLDIDALGPPPPEILASGSRALCCPEPLYPIVGRNCLQPLPPVMISASQQRPSSRTSLNGRASSPAFGAAYLDDPGTDGSDGEGMLRCTITAEKYSLQSHYDSRCPTSDIQSDSRRRNFTAWNQSSCAVLAHCHRE